RILNNSFWMMAEKIISIFGLIFVTSFVAKYVGPSIYGDIALSLSIFQLIQIVSLMGSDVIIFKRISKNINSGVSLIKATGRIRLLIYLILSAPVLIYFFSSSGYIYILASFLSCMFLSLDVYAIYYDACLRSKVNTIINIFGLIFSLGIRWAIAFFKYPAEWLFVPIVLTSFVPFLCRFIFFQLYEGAVKLTKKKKGLYTKHLLSSGSAFVLTSISVALYTRMSIFLLGYLQGKDVVGIFSIAATLATSWSFILYAFITSSLPSIFSEKDKLLAEKKTANLNVLIIMMSFGVIFLAIILAKKFILYFYGVEYTDAFYPLVILCFSTMLSALGAIAARYIAYFSGYSFLSKKTLVVTMLSVILNYLFIYKWGMLGAAVSTLLVELFSLTILNYFFARGVVYKLHKRTVVYGIKFKFK
ncbi:TPA: polysaccharide biosynthesis C-terminal domain-containing protein, partial [Klebsiella pneumoniae]|nr:polysaccharide biosynthesis C-terminal domain-containing protein [Klebsiella pneumoniae]